MDLANEVLDHYFGDFEVCDDAISEGTNGLDVAGRAAQHLLSFIADGKNLLATLHFYQRDHRRLIQNNALALHIDKRIRRAKIDSHVVGQPAGQTRKHPDLFLFLAGLVQRRSGAQHPSGRRNYKMNIRF